MKKNSKALYVILGAVLIIEIVLHLSGGGVFVLDDNPTILENMSLQQSLWTALKKNPFRAATYAVTWVNYQVSGFDAGQFHMVNAVLHLLVSMLLFFLVRELSDDKDPTAAIVATCWFALIPVTNFSVLYITARFALLATLWTIAALIAYLRYERSGKIHYLFATLAACVLALLSKETGLAASVMIVLLGLMSENRRRWAMAAAPLILVGLLFAIFRSRHFIYLGPKTSLLTPFEYFLTQMTVIPGYLLELFWPRMVALERDATFHRSILDPAPVLCAIGMVAAWVYAFRRFRSKKAVIILLWLPVTLAPESSLLPLVDVAFLHRVYMPAVAMAVVIGFVFAQLVKQSVGGRKGVVISLGIVALVCYAVSTMHLSLDWKTKIDVYRRSVRASPNRFRARYGMGVILSKDARYLEARPQLEAAVQITGPTPVEHAQALNALGKVQYRLDDFDGALDSFLKAIKRQPAWNDPVFNAGMAFLKVGRPKDAFYYLQLAKSMRHPSIQLEEAIELAGQQIENQGLKEKVENTPP